MNIDTGIEGILIFASVIRRKGCNVGTTDVRDL
jgi:hypothetical protein